MPRPHRWSPKDLTLINAIRQRPIIYLKAANSSFTGTPKEIKEKNVAYKAAWKYVSSETGRPIYLCQRRFNDIRNNYVSIQEDIRLGKVTEKAMLKSKTTRKYMDLTFLNEFNGSNGQPAIQHHNTNWNELSSSDSETIKIPQEINIQPKYILPTDDHEDWDDSDNEIIADTIKKKLPQKVSEVFIVSDVNQELDEEERNQEEPTDVDMDTEITSDPLQMFLDKYAIDNDEFDITQYFKELADVLCIRLEKSERQNFLNQIDQIVSDVLEECI